MNVSDADLRTWLRPRALDLDRATLGQLSTLLSLVGAESVADVGRKTNGAADPGTNARQKLIRLQDALKVGALVSRRGKYTRPTELGIRVAGEFRIFLHELRSISQPKDSMQTWVVAAGESWMQSLFIPAVTRIAGQNSTWKWELRNMRAAEIRSGLRDGTVHFGFIRAAEANPDLTTKPGITHKSYTIIAGDASKSPRSAGELIRWLLKNNRPFAQQGSTWRPLKEQILKTSPALKELERLEIAIACQSHTQAIEAAESGAAWCIVPSIVALSSGASYCRTCEIKSVADKMVLAYYLRALSKHAGYDRACAALCEEIGRLVAVRRAAGPEVTCC